VDCIAPDEEKRTGNLDRTSKESKKPDEWRLDTWDLMEVRNWNSLHLKSFFFFCFYESSVNLIRLQPCLSIHLSRSYACHMDRTWLQWMAAYVGFSVFCLFCVLLRRKNWWGDESFHSVDEVKACLLISSAPLLR
jgi:hypothetical protein